MLKHDKRNESLCFVVIYKGAEKYFKDYLYSLWSQDDRNVDLLIINDGCEKILKVDFLHTILLTVDGLSPAEIRTLGIEFAVENNYTNIIFTDIDDTFSNNRFSKSIFYLKKHNFVYNIISPTDGKILNSTINNTGFPVLKSLSKVEDIIDYNFIGLSNSAIQVKYLENVSIPFDIIAGDWYLVSVLLLRGATGVLIDDVTTYYLLNSNNTVGYLVPLNEERLKFGIKVKAIHYRRLHKFSIEEGLSNYAGLFQKKLNEVMKLKLTISSSVKLLDSYLAKVNRNLLVIYQGWWSEIMTNEQISKYE